MLHDVLRCGTCGARFVPDPARLVCAAGHETPVVDGIPRFVAGDGYAGNFGFEWHRFARTQLDGDNDPRAWKRDLYGHGEVTAAEESWRTFELKTGLTAAELKDKLVLDAGCGMGRFTDVASRMGARVVGVDLTRAIDSAARNLGDRDGVALVQADLTRLPFAPASFDVIFSIGVLHHTPSTEGSLRALVSLLKPGGTMAIWVYERAPWRKPWLPPAQLFSDLWRTVTPRLPNGLLLQLCRARAVADETRVTPLRRLLRKVVPASDHPDREWRVLDTFDWYSPRFQWKHTDAEVEGWFRSLGFSDIRVLPVPVAVRGRSPG